MQITNLATMMSGKQRRSDSREQFPVKLYAMLELAQVQVPGLGYPGGCSWLPHGRAFKILDEDEFMESVPMFFKQTKIRSFYRQLNLWGFKRVIKGVDAGAWYNESFLRGVPEEMKKMIRIKIKGTSNKDYAKNAADPDFYSMPPLPLPDSSEVPSFPVGPEYRRVSMGMSESVTSYGFDLHHNNRTAFYEEPEPMPKTTQSRTVSYSSLNPTQLPDIHVTSPLHSLWSVDRSVSPDSCTKFNGPNTWLNADLEPLPFNKPCQYVCSANASFDNRMKSVMAANIEPKQVCGEYIDEFSHFIDNVLQL